MIILQVWMSPEDMSAHSPGKVEKAAEGRGWSCWCLSSPEHDDGDDGDDDGVDDDDDGDDDGGVDDDDDDDGNDKWLIRRWSDDMLLVSQRICACIFRSFVWNASEPSA